MHTGRLVFAQILECLPHYQFQRLVQRHYAEHARLKFSVWEHFLSLVFAQLTYRESLRDIEACLGSRPELLYHLGFRHRVRRSTLADANEQRDWRIFAALAEHLMHRARKLYAAEPSALPINHAIYALGASLIDLSLALCPWANWTATQSAVKLHTLLDLRGPLPAFVAITEAARHQVSVLDELPVEAGSFYIMDRGYVDLRRLMRLHRAGAFFVIRAKANLLFYVVRSRTVDKAGGVRCDQDIRFRGMDTRTFWPQIMRRVSVFDPEQKRRLVFWTNNWALPAHTIGELYRQRWQVELFFRWIKQNLRLRTFYGLSPNAVRVQLWSAVCAYLLVAIARQQLGLSQSLQHILQVISVNVFQKTPLQELFANNDTSEPSFDTHNQLLLSGF
jgi:Domain of unknown function (DUF4372)/Transposase DDE domain